MSSGRLLEPGGNVRSRWMAIRVETHDRTRGMWGLVNFQDPPLRRVLLYPAAVGTSVYQVSVYRISVYRVPGAYRPTHVPTPSLLQLANRASHLLPTLTSHPESTQPSTDTHDSLSVGRSRGIFGETAHADNADLYGLDAGTTGESRQSAKSDGPREPSSCLCANHPRARPTSHATVFVRDRPRAQPSSHRLVVLHTISPRTVLRTRPSSHSTAPTRMHPSSVANRKTRRARRQLRYTPPRAPPRPRQDT